MIPLIMAALSLAKQKAQNEQDAINQLNNNKVQYNTNGSQMIQQQSNMLPQQSNGLGNAFATISSVYGGLFGKK